MNTPLVSVIIPNYCHAKYLDQRIQSVLNQTYQNFEVIILDDCSPDGGASKAVIEKYRNNSHVSHILYNENNSGSPYKQWKKGADMAQGELLWIAESDDYADEHFLEVLVPQFEVNKKVSVAFCRSVLFNEDGIIGNAGSASLQEKLYDGIEFIRKYLIIGTEIVNASSAIFSKQSYLGIDDIYTTFKGSGDHMFWVLLLEIGDVFFVDKPYNYFRHHNSNTTKLMTETGRNQIEDKRIFDYICDKGYLSKEEIPQRIREIMRVNVFELLTDKKVKKLIYKEWGFNIIQQISLKLVSYIDKIRNKIYC